MATVTSDRVSPGVTLLTLNRPERLNAMTAELIGEAPATPPKTKRRRKASTAAKAAKKAATAAAATAAAAARA